jgi:hypothetical protein
MGVLNRAVAKERHEEASLAIEQLSRVHRNYFRSTSVPPIEFRKPSELAGFETPEDWKLVGDYHIQRGAPFVIGGAPGCGKSRCLTALAIAGATGRDWMGLTVPAPFKTMIIQCENGPVRLANELKEIMEPEFDDWIRITPPPPLGFAFEDPVFCDVLREQIAAFEPDVVGVDPWNRVARDDKGRDYKEAFERLLGVLPNGDRQPALGIVSHTRKPKHDERTSGKGLMNLIAGSYVLASVPRSAFILQAASDDTEDNQVVWTCCKNNDGAEGARSAWQRQNGLFAPVEEFDWDAFDNRGSERTERRTITPELIKAILKGHPDGLTRAELVDQLVDVQGFGKSAAYEAVKRHAGSIREDSGRFYNPE